MIGEGFLEAAKELVELVRDESWCLALHGNHDEHQCHKKPGHETVHDKRDLDFDEKHECYCGVWW